MSAFPGMASVSVKSSKRFGKRYSPKRTRFKKEGLSASLGCRKALKLQAAHWRFQLGARVAAVKRHHCLQGDEYARPRYGIRGYAQFEAFSFVRDSFRNFNGAIKGDLPWREKC